MVVITEQAVLEMAVIAIVMTEVFKDKEVTIVVQAAAEVLTTLVFVIATMEVIKDKVMEISLEEEVTIEVEAAVEVATKEEVTLIVVEGEVADLVT